MRVELIKDIDVTLDGKSIWYKVQVNGDTVMGTMTKDEEAAGKWLALVVKNKGVLSTKETLQSLEISDE